MELIARYIIKTYTPKSTVQWPDNMMNPDQKRKNDFWITKEGEVIYPADMKDSHLINTINLIHRSREKLPHFFKSYPDLDNIMMYGPMGTSLRKTSYGKLTNKRYRQLWNLERQYMRLRQEAIVRGLGGMIK